jgi:hypothetical protein
MKGRLSSQMKASFRFGLKAFLREGIEFADFAVCPPSPRAYDQGHIDGKSRENGKFY